ncbi:MAG: hypothetical protein R2932_28800 [Caldilineaceae bacterium]
MSEYELSEEEALQQFRVWLWCELQDVFNVVSTEMRRLARAHRQDKEVEVLVPKDALHGPLIVRALLWLAENADLSEPPRGIGSEPGSTYEPILPDGAVTAKAEIDAKYIVWIEGNTQARIGVIVAYGQAFVPEYGIVPMKRFRWVNRRLAESPQLQKLLNDTFDQAFEAEEGRLPVEYEPAPPYGTDERYTDWPQEEFWDDDLEREELMSLAEGDVKTPLEQLTEELGDPERAEDVWRVLASDDHQRFSPYDVEAGAVRPVYRYEGDDKPLRVKSPDAQVGGQRWEYAGKQEVKQYAQTFRGSDREQQKGGKK